MGKRIPLLNVVTGKLEEHDSDETDGLVTGSGGSLTYPTREQVERARRLEAHGSTGEQALAAVESVGRTASFGAWRGVGTPDEIAGRRTTLQEQSPGVAFGAQAAGTVLPALAGGALVEAGAGAAQLGARAAGALSTVVEGSAGGFADEVEQADIEARPVSAGRALLTGIGGEVLGRALPAALKAGVHKLTPAADAAAVVAGEAAADVSGAAGKKARQQLIKDAPAMPPGRARDEALASTAEHQYASADKDLTEAGKRATELLDELGASVTQGLERQVPRTTPAQVKWAADTAGQLRTMAAATSGAERQELLKAAKALVDADGADEIWKATGAARDSIRAHHAANPPAPPAAAAPAGDDLEALLSKSVAHAKATKAAATLEGQTLESLHALPIEGADDLARVQALKADPTFAKTGRVASNDGADGITLVDDAGELVLRDGRHRVTAAQELGLDSVYGRKVDGKTGKVLFEGDIPLKAAAAPEAGGIKRAAHGGRLLDTPVTADAAPDFSTWDVTDFKQGRGAGKAAGKSAPDYSGGARISQYQRSIVDGLKKNPEFSASGRISGDAGKLGSEPTFVLEADGSVRLAHGRLRLTAARELGRDTVFGRVVRGKGSRSETVFEGQVRVGSQPARAAASPAAPAGGAPTPGGLAAADDLLSQGQRDQTLFGRAAKGADELHTSAQRGPGSDSSLAPLEDQLAAAERWQVGSAKTRQELGELSARMRAAQSLRDDTDRAVASVGAAPKAGGKKPRDAVGAVLREGAEALIEHTVGGGIPFIGAAVKGLWNALGDAGQAKVARTVRGLLSPVTSSGRAIGAARSAAGMTALQRFAGDAPDARSAYEGRRDMLAQVASNPGMAADVMAQSMAGLAEESPENFMGLTRRMTEALQYTAANLPPTVAVSLAYPTGIPIGDSELRDVADLWNTAMEPDSCLDDIERGRASSIQMRTLKEVHPDIYNDVRQELFLQAADTYKDIPSQTRLSMDIMFGTDGMAGLFATNEAARYITAARNAPPGKRAPSAAVLNEAGKASKQATASVEAAGPAAVRTGVTNKGTV